MAVAAGRPVALRQRACPNRRGEHALTFHDFLEAMRKASFQAPKKPWSDCRTGLFFERRKRIEKRRRGRSQSSLRRRGNPPDGGWAACGVPWFGFLSPSGALTLPIARCVPSVLCAPNLPGISSVGRAPAREAGSAGSNPAFLLIGLTTNQANTARNRAAVVTTANRHTGRPFPARSCSVASARESECATPRRGRAATAQPVEGVGAISSCRPPGGPAHRPLPGGATDSQGSRCAAG